MVVPDPIQRYRIVANKNQSIVFSGWKKSLDIAAILLDHDGIDYSRIDGSVPNPERLRVLENFNCNPGMKVLLMTIGTGAVGYGADTQTQLPPLPYKLQSK